MAKRLKKRRIGKETCEKYGTAPDGGTLRLCVTGRNYGFEGKLSNSKTSGHLVVPTGSAKTARAALRAAKAFLAKVRKR